MQKNLGSVACVFGCSGFLGSNLVAPLIREGWRIIAVTRSPYKNNKLKMFGPPGDVDLEKLGNLSDEKGIRKFLKVSTVVINLVGILNPTRRNSFQDIHVRFPKKLSKLCSEYVNIKKLIHISSGGIEASSATSSYAKSKLDGEKIILENLKNKSIILRPGIIVGIDDKFFNLFGTLSQFLPALPIIGNPSMQPVYVGDVVKSIVAVVEKEEIENKYQLTEITIRTGAIGMWLGFVKKWANRIDSLAASMRQKASELDRANTLEKRNKIDKELWTIKSDSDKALRSMSMYGSLISAAGGLGAVKNYKEIKKQLSKRRK